MGTVYTGKACVSSDLLPYFGVGQDQFRPTPYNPQSAKIGYTRTLSPAVWNEVAFFVNRMSADPAGAGSDAVRSFPQTQLGSGAQIVGPDLWDMRVHNTSFTLMDSLSWVKGRHQLKFGFEIVRNWNNKQVNYQRFVVYPTLDDFAVNAPFVVYSYGWPMVGLRGTFNNFFVQDDVKVSDKLTLNIGLRYQYDTLPTESHGRLAKFDFASGTLDPEGTPITSTPKGNLAPRFGFAYTPFSSKHTVIRGGVGILWTNLQYSLPPFVPANLPSVSQIRSRTVFDDPNLVGFPFPDISGNLGVPNLNTVDREWETPYAEQWSLNIQQQFGGSNLLQVGYIGNRSLHFTPGFGVEMNPYIPGTADRVYTSYGSITNLSMCCKANYNGLQVSFKRRLDRGLSLGAHYTWSHALDEATLISSAGFQDPANIAADYATADYDVTHNLTFYYLYEVPAPHGLPHWLGKGWQINGITSMRSGFPVNVICGCDTGGKGTYTGRPDLVPGESLRPADHSLPGNQINRAAFTDPAPGTFGNAGRNLLRGPSALNWDFSVFKRTPVREGQTLEFRFEVFNIFNTPQFATPIGNTTSALFGGSWWTDSTMQYFGTQRQIQFGLKYSF